VLQVVVVEPDPLLDRRVTDQPVHLGPSGHPAAGAEPIVIAGDRRREMRGKGGPFRPWPDQGHLTAQYVQQLRQLIEMSRSQPAA
jgi:hypothetical protein